MPIRSAITVTSASRVRLTFFVFLEIMTSVLHLAGSIAQPVRAPAF